MEESRRNATCIVDDLINNFLLSKAFLSLFPSGEVIKDYSGEQTAEIVNRLVLCTKHTPDTLIAQVHQDSMKPALLNNQFNIRKMYKQSSIAQSKSKRTSWVYRESTKTGINPFVQHKNTEEDTFEGSYSGSQGKTLVPLGQAVYIARGNEANENEMLDKLREMKVCFANRTRTTTQHQNRLTSFQDVKPGKNKENVLRTFYQYDGNVSSVVKPETIRIPSHYLDLGVEIQKEEVEKKIVKKAVTYLKKSKKNQAEEQEPKYMEIYDVFLRSATSASLKEGISMKQARGSESQHCQVKDNRKMEFLNNSELQPSRIKLSELMHYKQIETKSRYLNAPPKTVVAPHRKTLNQQVVRKQQSASNQLELRVLSKKGMEFLLE